jgi:hypothetical protein
MGRGTAPLLGHGGKIGSGGVGRPLHERAEHACDGCALTLIVVADRHRRSR